MDNYDKQRQEYYDRKMRETDKLIGLYFLCCAAMGVIIFLMHVLDL